MSDWARLTVAICLLGLMTGEASAVTQAEIDAAIKKGCDALRGRYAQGGGSGAHGIGPACLAGLAMLEGGVPPSDPALKSLTDTIRSAAYSQVKTYQISLCLLYLNRLDEPADEPLIQMLGVRLLVGQSQMGGWNYDCVAPIQLEEEKKLRAIKPIKESGPPKIHPEVEKYAQTLATARAQGTDTVNRVMEDNSNTQFAVIAVWLSRRHGLNVDAALDLVERKFMSTQNPKTGNWPYSGVVGVAPQGEGNGSAAMYCAGLIGLSTGIARREERRAAKAEAKKEESAKPAPAAEPKKNNSDDPFFNPPVKPVEPKKNPPKPPKDDRDRAADFAGQGLGAVVSASAQAGGGALYLNDKIGGHGTNDMYFFWSLERVGVIYGWETIGGIKWHDAGCHTLVHAQGPDGFWKAGGYETDVNTAFAVLFLCKSNLARDLSRAVKGGGETEMRAGAGASADSKLANPTAGAKTDPLGPNQILPGVTGNQSATLAAELVRSDDQEWAKVLKKLRDSRGGTFTEALVTATTRLEGDRLKLAREALAERLGRMTADTLRAMAKSEEPELRRGAILAMAMKDDKKHIPDLIAAIVDDEEIVVRAARAGLKSLTGQDFGPVPNANIGEKKIALENWRTWYDKQPNK